MNPIVSVSERLVRVERVVSRLMVIGFVALITVNVGMRYPSRLRSRRHSAAAGRTGRPV